MSEEEWMEIFERVMLDETEQSLYIQISRGVSQRVHHIDSAGAPTVFVMSQPTEKIDRAAGIHAITHEDIRWDRCDIKSTTLLACVLLRHRARMADAKEAILFRDGMLTEGAASNVFVVHDGVIKTPPNSQHLLPGVTRDLLVELLSRAGTPCQEVSVGEQEVRAAEEIWAVSSNWEVMPVVKLDDQVVGEGKAGMQWQYVQSLYQQYKDRISLS